MQYPTKADIEHANEQWRRYCETKNRLVDEKLKKPS